MRILVTGHRGHVGTPVARRLAASGHEVIGFDRADGQDLLDADQVQAFAHGCDAIVHLAGLAHDTAGTPEEITTANVQGTAHVLAAATVRVIHFSSAQVFGTAEGEGLPDFFPINDSHSRRAARPYGLSKCRAEDLCAAFTARTGVPTVSLRPTWVWSPEQYAIMADQWRTRPSSEWEPFWEFGSFVDERDVATAVELALTVPLSGHHRLLLCTDDIAATSPSLEMTRRLAPDVPVRDLARYDADPWCALVDCSAATQVLGWRPRYRWANRGRV